MRDDLIELLPHFMLAVIFHAGGHGRPHPPHGGATISMNATEHHARDAAPNGARPLLTEAIAGIDRP
jgi:hypothetical protein